MAYLPIFLKVEGCPCLVVGGGLVAWRKAEALLGAGAAVSVISPQVVPEIDKLARKGNLRHLARGYVPGDLRGFALVYAATDDAEVQREVSREARELSIPVNVVDGPEFCTFISPAIIKRGALTVAVSTAGASPAMARRIRERLERLLGDEYALALELHRAARRHLRNTEADPGRRELRMTRLAASNLPGRLRRGDIEGVNRILIRHVGAGFERLGFAVETLATFGRATGAGR